MFDRGLIEFIRNDNSRGEKSRVNDLVNGRMMILKMQEKKMCSKENTKEKGRRLNG